MARLIYSAIASLDGYVADENGNFDWAAPDEEVHTFVNDLERSIGTYLPGATIRPMVEQVSVSHEIGAPPEQVWAMVSDVTRMGEWSPENEGATWLRGAKGPQPGAKFRGVNRNGKKQWKTVGTIADAEPGRRFSFHVTAGGLKVAEWCYSFEPTATGCRVTETWIDKRGRIASMLSKPASGVGDRATHNRAGMEQTLERLAAAAESSPPRADAEGR